MKNKIFYFAVLLTFSTIACFGKGKKDVPSWVNDLSVVYPKEQYFSAIGYADKADVAKINALGTLIQNLQSNVLVVTTSELVESQDETGKVKRNNSIAKNVQIATNLELNGVEYSDTYFNKKKKLYYVAAYIENKVLFDQISLKAEKPLIQMKSFIEMAEKTKTKGDPLSAYKTLSEAETCAQDFLGWYYIMYTADKTAAKAKYATEVQKAYDLPLQKAAYLSMCSVRIVADNSAFNKACQNKLANKLKQQNFTIATDGTAGGKVVYTASVNVDLSLQEEGEDEDTLYSANPSVSVKLINGETVFSSWAAAGDKKIVSYKREVVLNKSSEIILKLLDEYPEF